MLDGLVSSHPKIRHNDTQYNDILYDDTQHDILHLITLSKKGLFVTLSLKCLFATLSVSDSPKKTLYKRFAECRVLYSWSAECRYAKCCGAKINNHGESHFLYAVTFQRSIEIVYNNVMT